MRNALGKEQVESGEGYAKCGVLIRHSRDADEQAVKDRRCMIIGERSVLGMNLGRR